MKLELIRSVLGRPAQGSATVSSPAADGAVVRPYAAVALVLRERSAGTEVLFIERAMREGDPWSGHMAFPGGRLEGDDDSPQSAARRETSEEVGLELGAADYLGHLCDLTGRSGSPAPMIVSAHAFHLERDQRLRLDPKEVRSAFWFPLEALHEPARRTTYRLRELPDHVFPAVVVGEPGRHFVWGLTYRFLDEMFRRANRPFVRD